MEGQTKKKRASEEQITRDEYESKEGREDVEESQEGTFKKADDNVIAARRIVKAKRPTKQGTEESTAAPATTTEAAAAPPAAEEKPEEKSAATKEQTTTPTAEPVKPLPLFNFGSSTSGFTFASLSNTAATTTTPVADAPTSTGFSFNFAASKPFAFSFGATPAVAATTATTEAKKDEEDQENGEKSESAGSSFQAPNWNSVYVPQEKKDDDKPGVEAPVVPTLTGEEGEDQLINVRAKLFELEGKEWRERGVGQLRLNQAKDETVHPRCRMIMRTDASFRLILNTPLFAEMTVKKLSEKAVMFTSVNEKGEPTSYLIRVAKAELADELFKGIETHKPAKSGSSATASTSASTTETPATESTTQTKEA